jgi:hypothetical protein
MQATTTETEEPKKGRRKRITPEIQADLERFLSNGLSIRTATRLAGIGERTYFRKCRNDKAFLAAMDHARERGVAKLVLKIASHDDWRGCAWLLERMHPERFAKTEDRKLDDSVAAAARPIGIVFNMGDGKLRRVDSMSALEKRMWPRLDKAKLLALPTGQALNPESGEVTQIPIPYVSGAYQDIEVPSEDDYEPIQNSDDEGSSGNGFHP